jgi:predicted nucleic acid-binding protein
MILLDANVILRLLTSAPHAEIQRMHHIAADLFRRIEAGKAEATVSDAVLAEVAFLLASPRHYGIAVPDVAGMLAALVRLRHLRTSDRQAVLTALDIWATRPSLGFVDALTAAQSIRLDAEIATFDRDFDGIDGVRIWEAPRDIGSP